MLIYVNITDRRTDRRTDRQTHQKYSSEPHKIHLIKYFEKHQNALPLSCILKYTLKCSTIVNAI
jgi:hypothetical protein